VVNLWFPVRIASGAWRSSTPYPASPKLALIGWWWALWIATNVAVIISRSLANNSGDEILGSEEEFDQAQSAVGYNILACLLGIAAAILAMLFVRKLTQRQLVKYAQGPAPAPYGGVPGAPAPGMPGMPPYGA
jgi:hypothetical protein